MTMMMASAEFRRHVIILRQLRSGTRKLRQLKRRNVYLRRPVVTKSAVSFREKRKKIM